MSRSRKLIVFLLAIVLAVFLFRNSILGAMGSYLVRTDPEEKADLVLVLAGDGRGDRIRKAAELVKLGLAPKVLVSGPSGMYGLHECDLAIPMMVKEGYPESYFIHGETDALSTLDEAQLMVPMMLDLGAKHVIVVTSDYHTRRAGRIFRARAKGMRFTVIAAPGPEFTPDGWWKNRQGQKIAFNEWSKTIAEWFGI